MKGAASMARIKSEKTALKKKPGRPSKYDTEVKPRLLEIEAWARNGDIDETIAHKLGIAYPSTFCDYKNKYQEFSEALKKGKEVVDIEVENSLLKRAMGYKYTETTKEVVKNPDTGEYKLTVTKEVTKEVIPDTTAQIFWLKNRKPKEWRDKQDIGIENSGEAFEVNIKVTD